MGLDAIDIVLRTEEIFATTLPDDELGSIRTVGDLYQLLCAKLQVEPLPAPITSATLPTITKVEKTLLFLKKHTPLPPPPEVLPWSPQSIWDTLVAIFVDQQGLEPAQITPTARLVQDLGID